MPTLLIVFPLLGIVVLNLFFRQGGKKIAFAFALAVAALQILLAIFHNPGPWSSTVQKIDSFFAFNCALDHLSFLMLLAIGIVFSASIIMTRRAMPDEGERFNFLNLLTIAAIGMTGIVMVKDFFSLYVFLEITAVSSFIMIAFHKDNDGLEGSFKYMILSAVATTMMLSAIAIFLLAADSTSFASVAAALRDHKHASLAILAIGLFMTGLFIKGGLVPFHGWLPDAYASAPTPASVLLAGIVTKVTGVYTIIRITTTVFGIDARLSPVLLAVGTISILFGAFAALGQSDFKRMLAYSSISQVGYIIVGLGTGSPLGIIGAAFHLFNHAIFKSLLFVNAAAVEEKTGTRDMNTLGGLQARMPITSATSVIAFLSTCGVPPLAGFWSKLIIIVALWATGHYAYAAIAVLASVLTLGYLLSIQNRVFFGQLKDNLKNCTEASNGIVIISITLAVITIGAGIFFPAIFNNFIAPIASILIR